MADELDGSTIAEIVCLTDKITRARTAKEKASEELEKARACHALAKSEDSATRVTNAMAKMAKAVEDEAKASAEVKALSNSIEDMLEKAENLAMVAAAVVD